ncbi:UNVERIFIED_CONTAM: hypothetical protein Sradi_2127400 [Sesamum radiatum]|uniref:Uncharacterized protein n=1 Tax=Sesamum radiatum TaxID=300843 RepID=A0AAW2TMG7_SESRA
MDSRRRQKWDNYRRSQNKRPPRGSTKVECISFCQKEVGMFSLWLSLREVFSSGELRMNFSLYYFGSWQPTVPSWEKEFCKVVGSLDWETLLQMKRFMHLYENVIKWNDSAGEEALSNAKKRFWAKINGLPCDISLPDPDLYIDKIDWDSEVDPQMQSDIEFEPMISNVDEDHDPVVIFGDSLLPNQEYSVTGWGDDEENFKVPAKSSSANHGDPWEQNWGNSFDNGGLQLDGQIIVTMLGNWVTEVDPPDICRGMQVAGIITGLGTAQ